MTEGNRTQVRYFAFYTWAYGAEARRKEFEFLEEVLELVRQANQPDSGYYDLIVIAGERLEFEPHTQVATWQVKDRDNR